MPEITALLPQKPLRLKANLHTHTTLSDGTWAPEETKRRYQAAGYAVVAFTDHNQFIRHDTLTDDTFVALGAVEYNINQDLPREQWDICRTWHLNFYDTCPRARKIALPPLPASYQDAEAINAWIAQMNELGFLACYNHPYWSLQTHAEYTALRGLFAMEIYNNASQLEGNYGYTPQVYDEMLRAGQRLYCLATDDNHNFSPPEDPASDSFGGYTVLLAESCTYAAVIDALKAGHFYASTGPAIEAMTLEGDTLTVRTSPVASMFLGTQGRGAGRAFAPKGGSLTEATFKLKGDEGYIRLTATDANGRVACSNAYFLDQLPL